MTEHRADCNISEKTEAGEWRPPEEAPILKAVEIEYWGRLNGLAFRYPNGTWRSMRCPWIDSGPMRWRYIEGHGL